MTSKFSQRVAGLLTSGHEDFGIVSVEKEEFLSGVRQTGFVWTEREGILCLAANRHYVQQALDNQNVQVVILPPESLPKPPPAGKCLIVSKRADELYHAIHNLQEDDAEFGAADIHADAVIHPTATIIGEVSIGRGSIVGARAVIKGPAEIGEDVTIEPGVIVGGEGLYAKDIAGRRTHVGHFGGVNISDGAFIHAGAILIRSAIRGERTRIGARSHIGVMANIGHDVHIGAETAISSNVVVAGRAIIGDRVWIGASATISNMIRIGNNAKVKLGSVVIQDVPENGEVSGNFALRHAMNMKQFLKEARDAK